MKGDKVTITDFLLARIEEDEHLARTCLLPENLHPYGDEHIPPIEPAEWGNLARNYLGGEMGEHCAQQNPARTLTECAAKRAILVSLTSSTAAHANEVQLGHKLVLAGMDTGLRIAVQHLAAVYRDHADYQQEWAADAVQQKDGLSTTGTGTSLT